MKVAGIDLNPKCGFPKDCGNLFGTRGVRGEIRESVIVRRLVTVAIGLLALMNAKADDLSTFLYTFRIV